MKKIEIIPMARKKSELRGIPGKKNIFLALSMSRKRG
jgi:hypothetical protein